MRPNLIEGFTTFLFLFWGSLLRSFARATGHTGEFGWWWNIFGKIQNSAENLTAALTTQGCWGGAYRHWGGEVKRFLKNLRNAIPLNHSTFGEAVSSQHFQVLSPKANSEH